MMDPMIVGGSSLFVHVLSLDDGRDDCSWFIIVRGSSLQISLFVVRLL